MPLTPSVMLVQGPDWQDTQAPDLAISDFLLVILLTLEVARRAGDIVGKTYVEG